MESLFMTAVAALVINGAVELAKRWNMPSEWMLLIMAAVAGAGYQVFQMYVPVETQQHVVLFATQSVGTAVLVYEFLIKKIKKSM